MNTLIQIIKDLIISMAIVLFSLVLVWIALGPYQF